jgi:diadenylate cyclase
VDWFGQFDLSVVLDILLMALFVYALLVWLKTRRAGAVLGGILIVAALYLLMRQFNLMLTARVFEQFFAVILIALVVIFQEELRHFFEQVTVWSMNRRLRRKKHSRLSRDEVQVLVRTLGDLAREKIGALIVIRGKGLILRHLDGGVDLNGVLSEPLFKSLFDPHSIGHDGAVVLEGNRVARFGCHLPLSKDLKKIGAGGTRHTAALGLAELSDALCLVVSEERGTISVARHGQIYVVTDLDKLSQLLNRFYDEISPKQQAKPWEDFLKHNWREKMMAIGLAVALWFVLIHGSELTYKTFSVPVSYDKLPPDLKLQYISPERIDLTFRGPRQAFYFIARDELKSFVNISPKVGTQRLFLTSKDLVYPDDIVLDNIYPQVVDLNIELKPVEVKKKEGLKPGIIEAIAEKTKEILPPEKPKTEEVAT